MNPAPHASRQGPTQESGITSYYQCPHCGKAFKRFKSQRSRIMFCSRKCYHVTMSDLLSKYYDSLRSKPVPLPS